MCVNDLVKVDSKLFELLVTLYYEDKFRIDPLIIFNSVQLLQKTDFNKLLPYEKEHIITHKIA